MKLIKLGLFLYFLGFASGVFAFMDSYELTRSTFNSGSISVTTSPAVLINSPLDSIWDSYYSISIWNISSSSAVYTLSASSTSSGSPALTCANGLTIGTGTATAPTIITEKFERLYMWVLACSNSAITDMRRAIRGR